MQWDNARIYRTGDFFAGSKRGHEVGVTTERHAITIAGAGSGKGATTIIPNIKRWPHNLLVIDPKGENARETVEDRAAMGQRVYVIDPFDRSKVDRKYIARFNPMEALDDKSVTFADDVFAIADGIVMRGHDPSSENWDDGAQELIAGLIAFSYLDGDKKNLGEVRDLLAGDKDFLIAWAKQHSGDKRAGGLIRSACDRILAQEGAYYISNAQKNTAWLDREPIADVLDKTDFSLSDLKNGKASVFLVLPANYLVSYGRMLRMFVRCAIEAMAQPTPEGRDRGEQCLFLLDEFFALGKIREIAVSAGLMRGYGLQLWPIMQDLGQLITLYGREGAETFFANADLHQFFGISDQTTAEYVSNVCGHIGMEDLNTPPPVPPSMPAHLGLNIGGHISQMASGSRDSGMRIAGQTVGALSSMIGGMASAAAQASNQRAQEQYQEEMNEYQRQMQMYGQPRVRPDEVKQLTQKKDDVVADYSINVAFGTDRWLLEPAPYFRELQKPISSSTSKPYIYLLAFLFLLAAAAWFLMDYFSEYGLSSIIRNVSVVSAVTVLYLFFQISQSIAKWITSLLLIFAITAVMFIGVRYLHANHVDTREVISQYFDYFEYVFPAVASILSILIIQKY